MKGGAAGNTTDSTRGEKTERGERERRSKKRKETHHSQSQLLAVNIANATFFLPALTKPSKEIQSDSDLGEDLKLA